MAGGSSGKSRLALEPPSVQCVATTRGNEETGEEPRRCRNRAIRGSTVCRMHGGSAGAVKNKARQRVEAAVAEAKIAQFLSRNEVVPVENPLEALRELAGEVVMVKDWLRDQVTNLSYESSIQGEQISAIMQLYSNFLDKSERILVNIGKLNIDERLSHIEYAQAQLMAKVMGEAMMKLLNDPDKRDQAKVIVGQLIERYDR